MRSKAFQINQVGFTLVELVIVMIIAGIVAAVAMPRFFQRSSFDNNASIQKIESALRYAQKTAISQRRFTCVTFTANSMTLSIGGTSACGSALTSPSGESPYTIGGVPFGASQPDFWFDPAGKPNFSSPKQIGVTGFTQQVCLSPETGLAYLPASGAACL